MWSLRLWSLYKEIMQDRSKGNTRLNIEIAYLKIYLLRGKIRWRSVLQLQPFYILIYSVFHFIPQGDNMKSIFIISDESLHK